MNITGEQLRTEIENNIINPTIESEIKKLIKARTRWKDISHYTELIGYLLIVVSTVFAFISMKFSIFNFITGCLNTAALALLKFSDYANNESKEPTKGLNSLLTRLNIPPLSISAPRPSISSSYESE
jgi:hypothetical protein